MISPLCSSQVPLLFAPETPPCVSLFFPVDPNSTIQILERQLDKLVSQAQSFVGQKYGWRQMERLDLSMLKTSLRSFVALGVGKTLAIFISPELTGYLVLDGYHAPVWAVAEEFYLEPLWERLDDADHRPQIAPEAAAKRSKKERLLRHRL